MSEAKLPPIASFIKKILVAVNVACLCDGLYYVYTLISVVTNFFKFYEYAYIDLLSTHTQPFFTIVVRIVVGFRLFFSSLR